MNRFSVVVAVLLSLVGQNAWGQVQYTVTDLDTLGGMDSYAYGINDSGQVVGMVETQHRHAFLYSGGSTHDLGTPSGDHDSGATGINNSGQVVGWGNNGGLTHAFLYSGSSMQDLGTGGRVEGAALGINNSGQIVGWAYALSFTTFYCHGGVVAVEHGLEFGPAAPKDKPSRLAITLAVLMTTETR